MTHTDLFIVIVGMAGFTLGLGVAWIIIGWRDAIRRPRVYVED